MVYSSPSSYEGEQDNALLKDSGGDIVSQDAMVPEALCVSDTIAIILTRIGE